MTSNTKEDLEEYKKTLNDYWRADLERMIEERGEEYVISILGHLKNQMEYIKSL